MLHVITLSLCHLLIGSGMIFQLGALYVFLRESSDARRAKRAVIACQKADAEAEAYSPERKVAKIMPPERPTFTKLVRYRRDVEGVMEEVPEGIRPSELRRTAKVIFKPTMKAYFGESQTMPSLRQ